VLFDTRESDIPHDANGVGWYYGDNESWGFAKQGDAITRSSCVAPAFLIQRSTSM